MTILAKEFLAETEYCDFRNSEIVTLAENLFKGINSNTERAVRAFEWVRDNIRYRVGLWNRRASETLREKEGTCTNKANLLVALLKNAGIPAGFGIMRTKGQDYLGPIVISVLRQRIGKVSTHIYTYVFLNDKWIKCDPADDAMLSQKTSYLNPQSKLVVWDGVHDALEELNSDHILEDKGPIANIDDIMKKKPRNARGIVIKVGNFYVRFLRENNVKVKNVSELEPLFYEWLIKEQNAYFLVRFFKIVSWYRNFLAKTTDSFWAKYMKEFDIMNRAIPYKELINEVLQAGSFRKGDVILDAGSGTGNFSMAIKKQGCRVISVDYSHATLEAHRRKDKEAETIVHDLRYRLPFEDKYFNKVICVLTLHVFSPLDRERVIKEFYRVLKPGGLIVLANPSTHFSSTRIFKTHLRQAMRSEGFSKAFGDVFNFFVPITKMFYYNFILEMGSIAGSYKYLNLNEQHDLLLTANFDKISKTKEVYAESAVLNSAIKNKK